MSKRLGRLVTATVLAMVVMSFVGRGQADTDATKIGTKIPAFQLKDTQGRTVSLASFHDKKALAVIFLGTQCPINNAYLPRLAELHQEFSSQGVQFLAINSNRQDAREQVAEHALQHAIPFPVLKDEGNVVANRFGARRTPEAFVLDAAAIVRYQGRIDDQFGIGYKKSKPTRRDLAIAIEEVLAGRNVSQPTTPVAGWIGRVDQPNKEGTITFTKHVAPILQKHCQECHRPGQIGPMPLLTYEDAASWSETIREAIRDERMPPWFADPRYGQFSNDRRMSRSDRETLVKWLDSGTPQGAEGDMPPPREYATDWRIGKPDRVVTMPREFEVPAKIPGGGIPYKEFAVDTGFTEDRWVVRAEARPGAPSVVHHIVVYVVQPGAKFYPGNPDTPALAGTAPGDMPLILPAGTAKKIPAGSQLIFQMHYTPNGTAQKDRSCVGLIFAREPVQHRVLTEPIANPDIRIPPGAVNYEIRARFHFRENGHIIGFMPHMHLRGKDFQYVAEYPDHRTEILLSVPRYNFNWQSVYRLAHPVAMPKGSMVTCIAHFDNSAGNPNNPDPTMRVFWGDQTWEEMMIGWMDYVLDRPAP